MANKMKKHRFFEPWIPPRYKDGIKGKKILVIGASYYCNRISCPYFFDCTDVDKKDSSFYDLICPPCAVDKRPMHDEPKYTTGETSAYHRFSRLVSSFIKTDENPWEEYLAFTNYVQFNVPCEIDSEGNARYGKTLPSHLSERDFLAFIETLQELQPDIVISWGMVTLSRIRENNEYVSKQDLDDCYNKTEGYYCRMNIPKVEHPIFLFNCYHPSSRCWNSSFDDAVKYMNDLLNEKYNCMKKVAATFAFALLGQLSFGQTVYIDDTTPYFEEQVTVVDTAKYQSILDKQLPIINDSCDAIYLKEKNKFDILERLGKNRPTKTKDVDEIEVLKEFVLSKAEQINYGHAQNSGSYLSLVVGKKYSDKILKGLEKGKIDPNIYGYFDDELWNREKTLKQLARAKDLYANQFKNSLEKPLKQITIKKDNPYYRPSILNNERKLDEVDRNHQMQGWEWVDTLDFETKNQHYPAEVSYRYYDSKPEYRIRREVAEEDWLAFDDNGNLIRVLFLSRNKLFYYENLQLELLHSIFVKDFLDNKYDINNASAKTKRIVKSRLGITEDKTSKKLYDKAISDGYKSIATKNKKLGVSSYVTLLKAMENSSDEQADKYIEQLESDHAGDFNNIYEVKRVGDKSFTISYFNNNLKPTFLIQLDFENNGPYEYKTKYKILPVQELQIK